MCDNACRYACTFPAPGRLSQRLRTQLLVCYGECKAHRAAGSSAGCSRACTCSGPGLRSSPRGSCCPSAGCWATSGRSAQAAARHRDCEACVASESHGQLAGKCTLRLLLISQPGTCSEEVQCWACTHYHAASSTEWGTECMLRSASCADAQAARRLRHPKPYTLNLPAAHPLAVQLATREQRTAALRARALNARPSTLQQRTRSLCE